MTAGAHTEIDWQYWLDRFEAKQNGFFPQREERFGVMLEILDVLLPEEFVALDLACGPGSISRRLLARFPNARCVAVDLDPILLAAGQHALGTIDGRLRWVEADLAEPAWVERLGESRFDAVLSTTALHWLPPPNLVTVYRQLGELLRPEGVLLNGDHFPFGPHLPTFQRVAAEISSRRRRPTIEREGGTEWRSFWDEARDEPALAELMAEQQRRFAWRPADMAMPVLDLHEAALRDAGFRETGIIWQTMHTGLLMAIR